MINKIQHYIPGLPLTYSDPDPSGQRLRLPQAPGCFGRPEVLDMLEGCLPVETLAEWLSQLDECRQGRIRVGVL